MSTCLTIRLRFTEEPEDQALYAALLASSQRECRTPLTRHVKYQLRMAMGLRQPDLFLLKRLGITTDDDFDLAEHAAAAYIPVPPSTRPSRHLRLIPRGHQEHLGQEGA